MSLRSTHRSALTMAALLVGAPAARPDEPITEANFPAFARGEARSFTIRRAEGGEEFRLREEPILTWTQPISGSVHGRVFIWTDRGRPEAVASIYKWFSPNTHRTDEFQSFSLGPLTAEQDGRPAWTPGRPGVELKPVPEAPAPADTPAQRLRQMREMSREFAARHTMDSGVVSELRVLSQPLYRYESTDPDLVDGALFALALGNDPEVFLLLEARRVGRGLQWQYALTRMNFLPTRVSYRGREVWSCERLPDGVVTDHTRPYTRFIIRQANVFKP
jgi:hypothetical protein